jgi:hypothetical protein
MKLWPADMKVDIALVDLHVDEMKILKCVRGAFV